MTRTPAPDARRRTGRGPVPHRRSTTLLGLVLPLAVLAVATVVTLSWRDELPDPIAVHFSGSGGADGFGALLPFLAGIVGVFAALVLGMWATAYVAGQDGSTRRIAVATSVFSACFGSAIVVGTAWMQRGLADAAQVADIDPVLLGGVTGSLLLAALVAWRLPGDRHQPAEAGTAVDGPRIPLAAQERAVWTARVGSRVAVLVGGGSVVLTTALMLLLRMPAMGLLAVALGAMVLALTVFVVTVDARGLTVRSTVGWPRFAVPLDEVVAVRTVEVSPLRDFGGWGYRVALRGGGVGVVSRTGPAIEVERAGGRRFVVTVDDAETGAALLATLADRARSDAGS